MSKRFFYIPESQLKNLAGYRYSGVDLSFLSRFILNPFWNRLVTFCPLWMAPNLITLIGLCFMVSATILTLLYPINPPRYLFLYISFCISTYLNMDAIDGKQARRTGTSSPLGELFDHGCDAINLMLMNVLVPVIYNYSHSSILAVSSFLIAYLTFYTSTWEEYHTGTLFLDLVSGPSEGAWSVVVCSLISFWFGSQVWDSQVFEFQFKWIVPLTFIFGGLSTSFSSLKRAFAASKKSKSYHLLLELMVPVCYILSCFILAFIWIPQNPNLGIWFIFMTGFPACFRISSTILAHITKSPLRPFYPVELVPLLLSVYKLFFASQYDEFVFKVSVIACASFYFTIMILIINDICTFLDINCLSIKHKKTQ